MAFLCLGGDSKKDPTMFFYSRGSETDILDEEDLDGLNHAFTKLGERKKCLRST